MINKIMGHKKWLFPMPYALAVLAVSLFIWNFIPQIQSQDIRKAYAQEDNNPGGYDGLLGLYGSISLPGDLFPIHMPDYGNPSTASTCSWVCGPTYATFCSTFDSSTDIRDFKNNTFITCSIGRFCGLSTSITCGSGSQCSWGPTHSTCSSALGCRGATIMTCESGANCSFGGTTLMTCSLGILCGGATTTTCSSGFFCDGAFTTHLTCSAQMGCGGTFMTCGIFNCINLSDAYPGHPGTNGTCPTTCIYRQRAKSGCTNTPAY